MDAAALLRVGYREEDVTDWSVPVSTGLLSDRKGGVRGGGVL
jgi:hypothetical protein